MQNSGTGSVSSVNALLLATITSDILSDNPAIEEVKWVPSILGTVDGVKNRKPIAAYSQVLERPIFFKSREPFVAPHVPQLAKVAPPFVPDPKFILGGVMITGANKKAYISNETNVPGVWVVVGDKVSGWNVRSIYEASVSLQQQNRIVEVPLYPNK